MGERAERQDRAALLRIIVLERTMPERPSFRASEDDIELIEEIESFYRQVGLAGCRSDAIRAAIRYAHTKMLDDPLVVWVMQERLTRQQKETDEIPQKRFIERIPSSRLSVFGELKPEQRSLL